MQRYLYIDVETYSEVDIRRSGAYAYTTSPSFEMLLVAFSLDYGEIRVVDLACGEVLPQEFFEAFFDENVLKISFNANFERLCFEKYFNKKLNIREWRCAKVEALTLGLPSTLEGVCEALGIKENKLKGGRELIKLFSCPQKDRKGEIFRIYPQFDEEKWKVFKRYCAQDVKILRKVHKILDRYSFCQWDLYEVDQRINDRGVRVDIDLVEKAILCEGIFKKDILEKARRMTGVENPNSTAQFKGWLRENGVVCDSLRKENMGEILKNASKEVREVLALRESFSKTSVRKYEAIKRAVCGDFRVRGLFQFYGANRTGRWAGRLVQVQNLPQNHLNDLSLARDLVKNGDFEAVNILFEGGVTVLSELIRTAFIPKENHRFFVGDFSAIEARVLAFLSGEKWRIDVFDSSGKIYEESASKIFKVELSKVTKEMRGRGKIAELALGYGGGVDALKAMGALKMGLLEEELKGLVYAWRGANANITRFWWEVDKAAKKAIKERGIVVLNRLVFKVEGDMLFIKLPSGRSLVYVKPRIEKNKFGGEGITYEGVSARKVWERIETYGPKLVENIVQGVSRDLLGEAMKRVEVGGYGIVMHVHDEIVVEVENGQGSLGEFLVLMKDEVEWIRGLVLEVEGYECEFYRKE